MFVKYPFIIRYDVLLSTTYNMRFVHTHTRRKFEKGRIDPKIHTHAHTTIITLGKVSF